MLYFYPERTRVAAALFTSAAFELDSDKDVVRRITTLLDLITLYSLREPRLRRSLLVLFSKLKLADITTENESIISLLESILYKSFTFDVLDTDKLYYENLFSEILDITGFNYNIYLTFIYEAD
jgi:hypothetical protein